MTLVGEKIYYSPPNSIGGDIVMLPFLCGWVSGRVRVSVCCMLPCGHNTDYSFCPITFKLQMQVVDDERRNSIDFGLHGQRSWSTWAHMQQDATRFALPFLVRLHFSAEELLLYPQRRRQGPLAKC